VTESRTTNSLNLSWPEIAKGQSGQAMVECAFSVIPLLLLLFGIVDLSRALFDKEVLVDLTRQGSNMASRGTALSTAANTVVQGSARLGPGAQWENHHHLGRQGQQQRSNYRTGDAGRAFDEQQGRYGRRKLGNRSIGC
jgi:hypothetical protein